jgi:MFS family permease
MFWDKQSYEVLPALSVRRRELRHSLRMVTAGWMFGIVWMTCVGGSRMNVFGRMLGFDDWHFGLLTSLSFIATFGQLFATLIIEQTGLRKYQFIYCMAASRLLWLAVAAVPLALGPGPVAIAVMLSILLVSHFLSAMGQPAWYTWMGDLIPRRIRGRYLAIRASATRMAQFAAVFALAITMDILVDPHKPLTAAAQPVVQWAVCAIFALGAIFGLVDVLLFLRIREVVRSRPTEPRRPAVSIVLRALRLPRPFAAALWPLRYSAAMASEMLISPMRDRVFRRYVIYGATITFAGTVAEPFFWRDMLESIRFSQTATDLMFMVIAPVMGLFAAQLWGRLIDRWGRRPVLMISTAMVCCSVIPYFLASRHTPNPQFAVDAAAWAVQAAQHAVNASLGWAGVSVHWQGLGPQAPVGAFLVMLPMAFFGGAGWFGVMLAQSGIILGFADGQGRSKYVAAHAVLLSVGGIVGATFGGWVAHTIASAPWYAPLRIGAFEWNNWHATFLLSFGGRVAALCLLFGMPDPGAGKVRDIFRDFGQDAYNYVTGRLLYGLRIFGWSPRADGPDRPDAETPREDEAATSTEHG